MHSGSSWEISTSHLAWYLLSPRHEIWDCLFSIHLSAALCQGLPEDGSQHSPARRHAEGHPVHPGLSPPFLSHPIFLVKGCVLHSVLK